MGISPAKPKRTMRRRPASAEGGALQDEEEEEEEEEEEDAHSLQACTTSLADLMSQPHVDGAAKLAGLSPELGAAIRATERTTLAAHQLASGELKELREQRDTLTQGLADVRADLLKEQQAHALTSAKLTSMREGLQRAPEKIEELTAALKRADVAETKVTMQAAQITGQTIPNHPQPSPTIPNHPQPSPTIPNHPHQPSPTIPNHPNHPQPSHAGGANHRAEGKVGSC